jgi:phosphoserine/homoserine phosphotransferase
MSVDLPTFLAADLEGVFIPEIWLAVAEQTAIPELKVTTREIADYDRLMEHRLRIMADRRITIDDLHAAIATLDPLPGALDFLRWARGRTRLVIITDSFYEFLTPLMAKLEHPLVLAHTLEVNAERVVCGYRLRIPQSKRRAVQAIHELGFRVMAVGDSYNDTAMLAQSDWGVLFRPPANVEAEFPQFPVARSYDDLRESFTRFLALGQAATPALPQP